MRSVRFGLGIGKGIFLGLRGYFAKGHGNASSIKYRILKEKNKMQLEEDIRENRNSLNAFPTFVGLGTDMRCNLRCIMCVQRLDDRKALQEAPVIEEKHLIKFAKEVFPTTETLQLNTAGEPLMSRNFDLELELAEEFCVKLDVITNGLLLNSKPGRLQKLCRNAGAIQFSFDSPVDETYESIRIGSSYDKVVENMRLFQKYRHELSVSERPFFGINMVVMKRNLSELLQMVQFAKEIGADHLGLARIHIHSSEMEEEALEPHQQEVNRMLLAAKELASNLGIKITLPPLYECPSSEVGPSQELEKSPSEAGAAPELIRCPFLWKRAYLDNMANIFVCCEPSHPTAGNIKEKSFMEIWNGENYMRMRRTFTGGPPFRLCDECARRGYLSKINLF